MILDDIVRDKRIRLKEHKARISEADMRSMAEEILRNNKHTHDVDASGKTNIDGISVDDTVDDLFYSNMAKPGISIIGEFKMASPSLGDINPKLDLISRIDEYSASADAISCLTEEDHFKGSVDYLKEIRSMTSLPILRKDFMIDEYQFYEAKVIGADAVLLITAILDDAQMKDFYHLSRELGLGVLTETHDEYEIERALKTDSRIIGINNRNLKDFSISIENTGKLKKYIPDDRLCIAESGIMNDDDVAYLKEVGVDGFLIGRAFMEAPNPGELSSRWKGI